MEPEQVRPGTRTCRICGGSVREFLDLGRQPISNAFVWPGQQQQISYFRLAVGICTCCSMVQQLTDVPRDLMFRADYPYRSSGSSAVREHFQKVANRFVDEGARRDLFVVEIGSNDGVMLRMLSKAGIRHLGVDPAIAAAEVASSHGVHVRTAFFEDTSASEIRSEHGPADIVYSANTISHIPYLESVFRGVDVLLDSEGLFQFEERYLGDILAHTYFDQIYDEHFYLFAVNSVRNMVANFGFELVDVEHLPLHGGCIRYTVARPGTRTPTPAVAEFLERERVERLADQAALSRFAANIERIRADLVTLLRDLRDTGHTVVGYGATSKSATVTNYCRIGTELVPFVCDTTPEKQGRISPGSNIRVRPPEYFTNPYPDYALLFAWNHAAEIIAKEHPFRESGGRWILYVPRVHII